MARHDQSFFRAVPKRDLLSICAGIGLLFAPLWAVGMADIVAPGRLPGFLIWCALAGLTGICWFLTGSYNRWFFIPAVILNIFIAVGGYFFESHASTKGGWFGPGTRAPVPTLEGGLMLLMLIGAFIMIIGFVRRVATPHMKMRADLQVASEIHAALVRPIDQTFGDLTFSARSQASSTMGGDLIDCIEHDDVVDIVLADVSGHGVRAGVVMALAKGVIHANLRGKIPLGAAVERINADLSRLIEPSMFVTAAFVRVPKRRPDQASVVLAGHPPLLHLSWAGKIARQESGGLPLGVMADEKYEAGQLSLHSGDRVVVYSDGLIETRTAVGEQFGVAGLEHMLTELRDQPPTTMAERSLAGVPDGRPDERDDRTIGILQIN